MNNDQPFKLRSCQVIPIESAIKFNDGEKVSLQPKFIDVLCYLAKHFPRVIPRKELIENIWDGNDYVGEKALTNAIWHLRQKLNGVNGEEEAIETIRKVGYRLLIAPEFNNNDQQVIKTPPAKKTAKKTFSSLIYPSLGGVLIFVIYFMINSHEPKTIETNKTTEIIDITKLPGSELFASPSPSGDKIVFKWHSDSSTSNLYLKDRNNPDLAPKQLTYGNAYVGHSVWSHSGQYLYFAKKDKRKNYCQIVQLKVETGQEKPIVDCPLTGGYYYIDISPDDKTLAFHGYRAPADHSGIYFIDLTDNTSEPIRFSCSQNCGYKERDFKFSPDGKSIAVSRRINRFDENIYLVDLATKNAKQLTTGEEDIVGMSWHPRKNKLVYAAQRADVRQGYILDLDNNQTTKLTIKGFSYPAFSHQSVELFFQQRSEKYSLANLTLASDIASSPFPVIQSEFSHHYPHYSPASKKIAYISNESGYYELWIADDNGKARQQLTHLKQTIRYPRWNNAGNKIAFLAPVAGEVADKIYIFDVNTKSLSIVDSHHSMHSRPTWSYDDDAIISAVYEQEYTDLHKIDIETGESTRLTFDGGRFGIMTNETTLLYTNEADGLWQKDIISPQSASQIISQEKFNTTYSWDISQTGVFYRQRYDNQYVLAYYDYLLKEVSPIVRLPLNALSNSTSLNYNASKQQLIFAAADSPQANIKKLIHPLLTSGL